MPKVSVIIATYNRSNVLALTIQSVLWQTVGDFELIVVGDCCTDDTESVVLGFKDDRIRFVNLEQNIGEQSGPNNVGAEMASGQYIAYLNHDDLWLPDHLEKMIEGLEETKSDFVFCLAEYVRHPKDKLEKYFVAVPSNPQFDGSYSVPASAWLLTRSAYEEIGPWKSFRETYSIPSQEFINRARKMGKKITFIPEFTAVFVPSGSRKSAYKNRELEDNLFFFEQIRDNPRFREEELQEIFLSKDEQNLKFYSSKVLFKKALTNAFRNFVAAFGIEPRVLAQFKFSIKKGGYLNRLRKNRGLPPIDTK